MYIINKTQMTVKFAIIILINSYINSILLNYKIESTRQIKYLNTNDLNINVEK